MNIKKALTQKSGLKLDSSANILLFQCFSYHVSGGSVANTEKRFYCIKGIQEEVSSNPSGLLYDDGCLSAFCHFKSSFNKIIFTEIIK